MSREANSLSQEASCSIVRARIHGPGSSWNNDIKCKVHKCPNSTTTTPDLWFYRLPLYSTKDTIRQKWLQQLGLTEAVVLPVLVCEKHFTRKDTRFRGAGKRSLKKNAIPTLLLPPPSLHFQKPLIRPLTKPKRVYERTVPDASKCKMIKPIEEESTQDNCSNNSGKNISNNNSQMIIDDITNESDDSQSNDGENQNDHESYFRNKDENQNNKDTSLVNDDYINENHSYLSGSTLSNETLNSLNDLYLKLKSKQESFRYKYSDEFKLKVIQLYQDHSEAYKLLQSTLGLPPVSTLSSYGPSTLEGINDFYISSLINKVGSKPIDHKFTVICVNVMRIQPVLGYDREKDQLSGVWLGAKTAPLQYAMIVMVRGILEDWHHIISISFLPSLNMCTEYCTFIEKLIIRMLEIGLTIKAVITTADDLFQTAAVLKSQPSFLIKNYKVYHIFDPIHLMLLLYDELNHHNVFYSKALNDIQVIATWEHINEFYKCDKTQKFQLTDKPSLINKNESHKNKLESATQILSFKTAMGMSMYTNMNILDSNTMDTVDFLVRINSIFSALNPTAFHPQNKVTQDDVFWVNSIEYIEGIRTALFTSNPKFAQYLIISMYSVKFLQSSSYLKEHGTVLMQCLNQDPLVEFIDKINLKRFNNRYPTETELLDTLRHGIIQNNYHNIVKIEEDNAKLDSFIENVKILLNQNCFITNSIKQQNMADYTQFNKKDANSMYFISIYLLDQMYKMYKNALSSRMKHMSSSVAYVNNCHGIYGSIIVPDNDFIELVNKMDVIFVTYYKKAIGSGRLFEELMKAMNKLIVKGPVDLAPLQYIKGLFLELRIYHTIQYNNETFRNNESGDQQFVACRLNGVGLCLNTPYS